MSSAAFLHWICSRDDVVDYIPGYVGQSVIAAAVAIGELGVVDAEQIQDGRVNVVDMHGLIDCLPAKLP